jgi:hypothetical protein
MRRPGPFGKMLEDLFPDAASVGLGRLGGAHAAAGQGARDSRTAVAGSEGIMLVGGVPAQTRRVGRRLAGRWRRYEGWRRQVRWDRHEGSQSRPAGMRNDRSGMSPSPQQIASAPSRARPAGDELLKRDARVRSTIARPLPAQAWRRSGGRSPRSAPGRAGSASHPNRPPSRRSGRLSGPAGGPGGCGTRGSRPTAAQPARCRRGAHSAGPYRSGLRRSNPGTCSRQESWHPPLTRRKRRARPGRSS